MILVSTIVLHQFVNLTWPQRIYILQPHYGNGVFGNIYFSAGQHSIAVIGVVDMFGPGMGKTSFVVLVDPYPFNAIKRVWIDQDVIDSPHCILPKKHTLFYF